MAQKSFLQLEHSLEKIQSRWPHPMPQEVSRLFEQAQKCLHDLKKRANGQARCAKKNQFNFVDLIYQVLKTHDLLFLSRHLSYHVVTTTDLPLAYGSGEEALAVLTELLATTAKQAGFGSRLEIQVKGVQLREGPAVEVKFVYEGKVLSELDRQKILEQFYGKETGKKGDEGGIAYAKAALRRVGVGLWLEFPKETHIALTFNWPAFDISKAKLSTNFGTYKFDIWITDYNKIRQRFGIARARKLMTQIEAFVKMLVRYPVDMVIAFPAQGMITAIYDAQEGIASSVTTRISQRLKKEAFRLGRKNVTPHFRYRLSFLA